MGAAVSAGAGFLTLFGSRDETAQISVSTPRTIQAVGAGADLRFSVAPDIGQANMGVADLLVIDQAFVRLIASDASGQLQVLDVAFSLQGNGVAVVGSQLINPPLNLRFGTSGATESRDFSFQVVPVSLHSVSQVTAGQGGVGPVYDIVVRNNDAVNPHSLDVQTTTIWRVISRRMQ